MFHQSLANRSVLAWSFSKTISARNCCHWVVCLDSCQIAVFLNKLPLSRSAASWQLLLVIAHGWWEANPTVSWTKPTEMEILQHTSNCSQALRLGLHGHSPALCQHGLSNLSSSPIKLPSLDGGDFTRFPWASLWPMRAFSLFEVDDGYRHHKQRVTLWAWTILNVIQPSESSTHTSTNLLRQRLRSGSAAGTGGWCIRSQPMASQCSYCISAAFHDAPLFHCRCGDLPWSHSGSGDALWNCTSSSLWCAC